MSQVVETVTLFLLKENVISEEDKEVYLFGIKRLLSNLIDVLIVMILALAFGKITETFLLCLGFIPLRRLLGGFHKDTMMGCKLLTYTLFLSILVIEPILSGLMISKHYLILILICGLSTAVIGPVDHKHLIMSERRKSRNKKSALLFIGSAMILVLIVDHFLHQHLNILFYLVTGMVIASTSLVFGKMKKRRNGND